MTMNEMRKQEYLEDKRMKQKPNKKQEKKLITRSNKKVNIQTGEKGKVK